MNNSRNRAIPLKGIVLLILMTMVLGGVSHVAIQSQSPAAPSSLRYRNYSQVSAQYRPLKAMSLKATSVTPKGTAAVKVLGTTLKFARFDIVAPVTVQTSCNLVSGTYDTALAQYSLSVAPDPTDAARRELLKRIRAYWRAKTAEELRDYKYLPAEKYLWMKSGHYVLYQQPDNEWEGATYLLYASGRVVLLTFKGFIEGNGWGGLSTFVDDNLLFEFPNAQIRCGYTPDISPPQFFAKDKSGYFAKPPK